MDASELDIKFKRVLIKYDVLNKNLSIIGVRVKLI